MPSVTSRPKNSAERPASPGFLTSRILSISSTNKMIFSAGTTLSFDSRTFTLRPGAVIAAGTPSGIGYPRTPRGCCTTATWSRWRSGSRAAPVLQ
ncbi:fumarylacetoacetate hydrolase family protein [Streptosporangium amethystogenes subsp. fukuiense]|uniref:Fumarylacetoacetate hydrolase family protein n=1 Tax=Streptosporangium amethystogenes subsp. fukuiense TaxID=698418 RepID=A0ABW2SXL1_9ACTN